MSENTPQTELLYKKNKPIDQKQPDWSNPDDLYELVELGKNIEK